MKIFTNEKIIDKRKKLLFLVYNDYTNYTKYFDRSVYNEKELSEILKIQINLMKKRMTNMENTLYLSIIQ